MRSVSFSGKNTASYCVFSPDFFAYAPWQQCMMPFVPKFFVLSLSLVNHFCCSFIQIFDVYLYCGNFLCQCGYSLLCTPYSAFSLSERQPHHFTYLSHSHSFLLLFTAGTAWRGPTLKVLQFLYNYFWLVLCCFSYSSSPGFFYSYCFPAFRACFPTLVFQHAWLILQLMFSSSGGARKGRRSQGSPGTRKGQKSCATADVEVITAFLKPRGNH